MSKRFTLHASRITILFSSLLFAGLTATQVLAANGADCNKQGACGTTADCGDTTKFDNLGQMDCEAGYVCCRVKTSSQPTSPSPAPAAGSTKTTKLGNPLCGRNADGSFKDCDFADVDLISIINRVIRTFLGLAGSFGLLAFVWGGITYMTAGGDKGRVEKAQKVIKYAVIGIVIIVFSYIITSVFLDIIVPSAPAAPAG